MAEDRSAVATSADGLISGFPVDRRVDDTSTPFGAGASETAIAAATAAIAEVTAGKPIFVGQIKDNTGKVVVDKEYDNYDPYLDGMNWLLEGVQGSIT